MEIPLTLRQAIESFSKDANLSSLIVESRLMSDRYLNNSGQGNRLVSKENEVLAYVIARMPATFTSIYSVLKHIKHQTHFEPKTMIDFGAGSGAAAWAAQSLFNLDTITCIEREPLMISAGKNLAENDHTLKQVIEWKMGDILSFDDYQKADISLTSYVFNEISISNRQLFLQKLWNSTNDLLVIIEPGTPSGYKSLIYCRDYYLSIGANIVAPCPHHDKCPLPDDDWCHFVERVSRSRLHKILKQADVPYEDEKFSYMVFSKKIHPKCYKRILRKPLIRKGFLSFELCTKLGVVNEKITRSQGVEYKYAKKYEVGDSLDFSEMKKKEKV